MVVGRRRRVRGPRRPGGSRPTGTWQGGKKQKKKKEKKNLAGLQCNDGPFAG
jgi:hypothetical protein